MAHNLYGDISPDDRKLAKELEEMEKFFDSKIGVYENSIIAKGFLCCAHDWYSMFDEDKGALLLGKANSVCPGYFNNEMQKHMAEDPTYNNLVKTLTGYILELAKDVLRK